jgi:hypothetical protein
LVVKIHILSVCLSLSILSIGSSMES